MMVFLCLADFAIQPRNIAFPARSRYSGVPERDHTCHRIHP